MERTVKKLKSSRQENQRCRKTTIPVSFLIYIRKEIPMYGIVKRLDIDLQKQILQDCRSLLSAAPLYSNYAPRRGIGRRDCSGNCETCFTGGNVRMAAYKNTNFGPWGYYAPPCGSRYVHEHPTTGEPFPPVPASILAICKDVADQY